MRRAMEHAVTSPHSTVSYPPSTILLIFPRWEQTPYRHSKYITSPYTPHVYTLPNDANIFLPLDYTQANPPLHHSARAGWWTSTSSPTPSHFSLCPRTLQRPHSTTHLNPYTILTSPIPPSPSHLRLSSTLTHDNPQASTTDP
jgi:hypothetical protein